MLQQTRVALSAPVRLTLGETRFRLPRWRIAGLLALPSDGSKTLRIGGPGADRLVRPAAAHRQPSAEERRLRGHVDRRQRRRRQAGARPGRVAQRASRSSPRRSSPAHPRVAALTVATTQPDRTTADAKAMGITGVVGALHDVVRRRPEPDPQRPARRAADRPRLIAPGATFSFNGTTGARTAAKGFLEAPVIINGELATGLGGGVCQVSTTVFNAAYEAGLRITARTNHALYISHYPLGRDATVNYPDTDLKFVNDTATGCCCARTSARRR